MDILALSGVTKSYGSVSVIRDLEMSVPEHAVFGLIGKNGAGKTTTMKMILGFLAPDSGEIAVCGEKVTYGNTRTNRHIGYLPDVPEFYGYMKPHEYLRLCGEIAGLNPGDIRKRTEELLALVGLEGVKRKIHGFSRGMKQRLGIAQALLSEPKLLICDEPTSALDPVGRKEILDILAVAGKRTSIVFSTHILSDVERICDHIGILDGGKLMLEGALEEIKNSYRSNSVKIELADERSAIQVEALLKNRSEFHRTERSGEGLVVRLAEKGADSRTLFKLLAEENAPVLKFELLEPSLEDVFLEVIR